MVLASIFVVWFTTLVKSCHYDILESSIGGHSSVSTLDINRDRQNVQQLGFGGNSKYLTLAGHSVSGFDLNFGQLMFNVGNTYKEPIPTKPKDRGSDGEGPSEDAEEDSRIVVLALIVNIRSQYDYTSLYCKAWIAKQKALNKMHNGWDASYNDFMAMVSVTEVVRSRLHN
ncbi:hypothetical protein PVK06_019554 [Gossypium arboreum]|uniref:Uncharacterized protein n=1 Tax=Gossypium arboreum TaxID=29729 RepID=A0ABR0PKB5_GOSAR|nr:hypothetical protein PVK06_019554 [Gossypium arboreum]